MISILNTQIKSMSETLYAYKTIYSSFIIWYFAHKKNGRDDFSEFNQTIERGGRALLADESMDQTTFAELLRVLKQFSEDLEAFQLKTNPPEKFEDFIN